MDNEKEKILFAIGFEKALLGIGIQFNTEVAVYDYEKCIKILTKRDKLTLDEAEEFMEFNVIGSYVGKHTPIFIKKHII